MDQRTWRIEARERRSFPANVAFARRIGRCPQLVQEFCRAPSLHRAVAEAPWSRAPTGRRRFPRRSTKSEDVIALPQNEAVRRAECPCLCGGILFTSICARQPLIELGCFFALNVGS